MSACSAPGYLPPRARRRPRCAVPAGPRAVRSSGPGTPAPRPGRRGRAGPRTSGRSAASKTCSTTSSAPPRANRSAASATAAADRAVPSSGSRTRRIRRGSRAPAGTSTTGLADCCATGCHSGRDISSPGRTPVTVLGLAQCPDHLPGRAPGAQIGRQAQRPDLAAGQPGDDLRRLGHRLVAAAWPRTARTSAVPAVSIAGHARLLSQPPGGWRCPPPCAAPCRPALPSAGRRPISRSGHG